MWIHRVPRRWWMAPVAMAVVAAHALVPTLVSHVGVSAVVASGLVAIGVVKHLGGGAIVARSLYERFHRRR